MCFVFFFIWFDVPQLSLKLICFCFFPSITEKTQLPPQREWNPLQVEFWVTLVTSLQPSVSVGASPCPICHSSASHGSLKAVSFFQPMYLTLLFAVGGATFQSLVFHVLPKLCPIEPDRNDSCYYYYLVWQDNLYYAGREELCSVMQWTLQKAVKLCS